MTIAYQLKNITKTYDVGKIKVEALRGLSIELKAGEFVALQGPSGSGKSTLLNILGLLEQPTTGDIIFRGKALQDASEGHLTNTRQHEIGFIFQSFNLVPVLSAQENVEYALYLEQRWTKKQIKERSMQMLKAVGLERFALHKPAELSGGQRQRVAIARALVKEPKLIIADEPTANLDSKTAMQILELIKELQIRMHTCVLIATHDPVIGQMADRVVRIKDGVLDQ